MQLQVALQVLPALPADVWGWTAETGGFTVAVESAGDGLLRVRMPSKAAGMGVKIVLSIDAPDRGGYDIVCSVAGLFYGDGAHSTAELIVDRVERRKPYRTDGRAELNDLCLLAVAGGWRAHGEMEAKLIDLSPSGVAVATTKPLDAGDLLQLTCHRDGSIISARVLVIYVKPLPFGRFRAGCRIVDADDSTRESLRRLKEHHGASGDDHGLRAVVPDAA
jgi:hypothetical protein